MGAGQSAEDADNAQEIKTSYYELIGVTRQATDDEIKKAYRRKALELHPDRNYGREEAATKTFAEVQAAYEVLSDPQERAWYDSHESAILRGDDGANTTGDDAAAPMYANLRITTADDLARLVRKFSSNVEFSDAPSGFFGFVRETFEHLAKEEEVAASWENLEPRDYPTFGHKDDAYGDVVKKFYAAWASFSTVKTFAWRDKYRLSEAPDRWYRRRMEQENKSIRQEAKKEFNEAVRSLIAFVRKRDPRYVPSTQTEEERQKVLREAAAAQAARARAANQAKLNEEVPEWTKIRDPEDLEESEEEEESEQEVFECVACSKIFKSERQWQAHEKSKKHQKAMHALRKKMRKENAHLDLDGEGVSSGVATPDGDDNLEEEEEKDEEQDILDDMAAEVEDHTARTNGQPTDDTLGSDDSQDEDGNRSHEQNDDSSEDLLEKDTLTTESNKPSSIATASDSSDEDSDYASREAIAARLEATSLNHFPSADSTPALNGREIDEDHKESDSAAAEPVQKKIGKAAQKRAKKAAAAASAEQPDLPHQCSSCHAAFPSKTQLFQHIKDHPDHAKLKSASGGGGKGGGKKKGKR